MEGRKTKKDPVWMKGGDLQDAFHERLGRHRGGKPCMEVEPCLYSESGRILEDLSGCGER